MPILEQFPSYGMMSKAGFLREEDFYLDIDDKKDFLDYYTIYNRCTDKQIKFFNSVMDGKLNFVKHALNIGTIRNDHKTMRAAIILACRFGQPQILDCLIDKVYVDFFLEGHLNFIVTLVAGCSEARRLEANQEPSGILDILIKYDRETINQADLDKIKWVKRRGKFDFTWILLDKYETSPFLELCGRKNRCMSYVIKKILDSGLVDVSQLVGNHGQSALRRAIQTGDQEVVKLILDKTIWINKNPEGRVNQLQYELVTHMYYLSNHIEGTSSACECACKFSFNRREDRIDIIQMLMDKCFRVNSENKIGFNNDLIKNEKIVNGVHDHFEAMVFEVIEEERRIAYAYGKITRYDLKTVKGPDGKPCYNFHTINQLERYLRSIKEDAFLANDLDFEELLKEYIKKKKCWSCGHCESELLVCKQCRKARYCDPLCQDEHWDKHQGWCHQQKIMIKKERQGETRGDKELRKAKQKSVKEFNQFCRKAENGDLH